MLFTEAAAEFELAISGGTHSPKTITAYMSALGKLQPFVAGKSLNDVSPRDIRQWQAHYYQMVVREELSVYSLHQYVRSIKRFFNWCVDEELIDKSPAKQIKPPKLPKNKPPKNISDIDLERILDAAFKSGPRDYALIRVLASSNCRLAGLVGMTIGDLELVNRRAMVLEKDNTSRWVRFDDETVLAIQAYLIARPTKYGEKLWVGRVGLLTRWGVRQLLERLAKRSGVEGRFNPHAFRHAWARRAADAKLNLDRISKLMGHSSIKVTADFYSCWTESDLDELHYTHNTMKRFDKQRKL